MTLVCAAYFCCAVAFDITAAALLDNCGTMKLIRYVRSLLDQHAFDLFVAYLSEACSSILSSTIAYSIASMDCSRTSCIYCAA